MGIYRGKWECQRKLCMLSVKILSQGATVYDVGIFGSQLGRQKEKPRLYCDGSPEKVPRDSITHPLKGHFSKVNKSKNKMMVIK